MLLPFSDSKTVLAGAVGYADLGHYQEGFSVLEIHVSGTLTAGASCVLTAQVSTDADAATYSDVKMVDLTTGTSLDTLVANVTKASTFGVNVFRLAALGFFVRLKIDNGGGTAGAVIATTALALVD
jgi:hypothetical protein